MFPFPFKLQSGDPGGESGHVAYAFPSIATVNPFAGVTSTTFDGFVVLSESSVHVNGGANVRFFGGGFEEVNEHVLIRDN